MEEQVEWIVLKVTQCDEDLSNCKTTYHTGGGHQKEVQQARVPMDCLSPQLSISNEKDIPGGTKRAKFQNYIHVMEIFSKDMIDFSFPKHSAMTEPKTVLLNNNAQAEESLLGRSPMSKDESFAMIDEEEDESEYFNERPPSIRNKDKGLENLMYNIPMILANSALPPYAEEATKKCVGLQSLLNSFLIRHQ
ncbi:hypothetical protein R1flu_027609 [Riccia fluitans]|uniref:BESS domain-containing protein n=1 Tax=Riccia fluitans TaxID=41844 RepID=A0ABD1XJE2_9MARC